MLNEPRSYNAIVQNYGLSILFRGGDLSITASGDLALSKTGDIKNGSTAHDAMFRLVTFWRLNAPSMRLMFETMQELRDNEASLEAAVESNLGPSLFMREDGLREYYEATDALATATIGRSALAGSLMIVASSLLNQFKHNVEASAAEWDAIPGQISQYSLGQSITAAANSFRHYDEWVTARFSRQMTKQQMRSMQILIATLDLSGDSDLFHDTSSCERLAVLVGRDGFDHFESEVLKYANAVACQVEARPNAI